MSDDPRDPLDAEQWARVQQLFHAASALPADAWGAYLAEETAGEPSLCATVRAMLTEDALRGSLLDGGLAATAHAVLSDDHAHLPMETAFGPYRLLRQIGEGGMAVVYLAERADLGSSAAVKLLHDPWLSPARRERFASEQRTLAQLNHPGIAHLYDAGVLPDGTQWIAMEYVDGESLTEYCRTHALGLDARLQLFREVCDAVQHAHGHLVVHRDLKPSNILVTHAGHVKLLDFGIAKQLDPADSELSPTKTGLQLMTPAYASPEQLRGETTGVYTDVYALGVVLYEMLAGTLPFDIAGRTPGESEMLILTAEPVRPSVAARGTTQGADANTASWADLDVLCFTAMHREASRRYRTVDALIRDIDHYRRKEPLEARPDSTTYRLGKFVRRHRGALTASIGVLSILLVTGVVSAARIRTARDAAVVEADRAQRIQHFTLSLFAGGAESSEPGDSLRAVTLVERGVVEAATLGAEPVVQAELYQTLGSIFQKLGQLDRADTLLQQALRSRRRLAADHPDVARSLVALGLLRVEQSRLPEAEQLVRDGLALSQRVRPAGHLDVAVATTALGRVLEERATYADAITVMREALRLHTAIAPVSPDVVTAATQLGNDLFYAGEYDRADSLFRHSMTVAQALYGDRHPLVADALINMGAVRFQRADYAAAERLDRDGLQIMQFVYGTEDPRTASALTMLGRALVAQTRFSEAVPLVKQALAIQERVYGNVSPKVASTVNELGIIALREKQFDDADAYFARNTDIYRAVFKRPHNLLATALANRGSVFSARGDNVQAERYFREAVAVFSQTVAPTHVDIGIARVKLGRVLLRQRRFADAERESEAGLAILTSQMSPGASWVKNARSDLVQVYDSLGRSAKAAAMRVAQADTLLKR